MDTKSLGRSIKTIIKTGSGYGPEYLPVLTEMKKVLKRINKGKPSADYYFQLGNLCLKLEDSLLAIEAFKTGYQLNSGHLNCGTYYAILLEQQNLWQDAITIYEQLNDEDPDNIEIVERMLIIYYNQNDLKLLLTLCHYFLEKKRYYPAIFDYMSKVYFDCGNLPKAIEHIKNALSLDKSNHTYQNRLIILLYKDRQFSSVVEYKEYIWEHSSGSDILKLLYANSLAEIGNKIEARGCFVGIFKESEDRLSVLSEIALFHMSFEKDYDKASFINKYILKRDPNNIHALTNVALTTGQEGSLASYEKVLQQRPDEPIFRMNYGHMLLQIGELKKGFEYYESRVELSLLYLIDRLRYPESIKNKKIFIWNEQGIGDVYVWSWFFKFLKKDNIQATIQVDERLMPIMKRSFPEINFRYEKPIDIFYTENFTEYDAEMVTQSLGKYYIPEILSAQEKFEAGNYTSHHLIADKKMVNAWKQRLAPISGNRKTVGICWRSGITSGLRDRGYLSAENIIEIFADIDCIVVNLQYDYLQEEIDMLQSNLGERFINFHDIDLKDDQDDLAALISALDYVFTVGTAVYALAGALGITTLFAGGGGMFGKPYNVVLPSLKSIKGKIPTKDVSMQHFQTEIINELS